MKYSAHRNKKCPVGIILKPDAPFMRHIIVNTKITVIFESDKVSEEWRLL